MKTAIVGGPDSRLYGHKAKCCNRTTKTGETILWSLTANRPGMSWRERVFSLHVECLKVKIAAAPVGAPVGQAAVAAEVAALRAAAAA